MATEDKTGMRPKLGDTVITLPVTFDYSGGRSDKNKNLILWAVLTTIIGIIVVIGLLISDKEWYIKIPLAAAIGILIMVLVRYGFLGEKSKKEEYNSRILSDGKLDYGNVWGIYRVEDTHPYICRFRNGKSGVYIRLNKDVILGKYIDAEYQHYEAIADAYNLAGAGKVQMVHIDYMDNVGTDDRLEESLIALNEVSNPDIKDLLSDMYTFQQQNIMNRVNTFDVYAFLWVGNDVTAWNTITRILNCFLEANYRSYHILNADDLRELSKIVFNLNDFSIVEASSSAFMSGGNSSVTPISIMDKEGNVEILNKTREERKQELLEKENEKKAKKKGFRKN